MARDIIYRLKLKPNIWPQHFLFARWNFSCSVEWVHIGFTACPDTSSRCRWLVSECYPSWNPNYNKNGYRPSPVWQHWKPSAVRQLITAPCPLNITKTWPLWTNCHNHFLCLWKLLWLKKCRKKAYICPGWCGVWEPVFIAMSSFYKSHPV